jgi:hypothetical protein
MEDTVIQSSRLKKVLGGLLTHQRLLVMRKKSVIARRSVHLLTNPVPQPRKGMGA